MNDSSHRLAVRIGIFAFALSLVSSLLYYLCSDGVRFLLRAIASGGRNLMVGA